MADEQNKQTPEQVADAKNIEAISAILNPATEAVAGDETVTDNEPNAETVDNDDDSVELSPDTLARAYELGLDADALSALKTPEAIGVAMRLAAQRQPNRESPTSNPETKPEPVSYGYVSKLKPEELEDLDPTLLADLKARDEHYAKVLADVAKRNEELASELATTRKAAAQASGETVAREYDAFIKELPSELRKVAGDKSIRDVKPTDKEAVFHKELTKTAAGLGQLFPDATDRELLEKALYMLHGKTIAGAAKTAAREELQQKVADRQKSFSNPPAAANGRGDGINVATKDEKNIAAITKILERGARR